MQNLTFDAALEGYKIYAETRLSENTLGDYYNTFNKFRDFLGVDMDFDAIKVNLIEKFLFTYKHLSKKTLVNYHVALCALWTWAFDRGFVSEKVPQQYKPLRPDEIQIVPYSEAEIKAMFSYCNRSLSYSRPGKRETSHEIPEGERLKAMLFLLLDTGIRASELCNLKLRDVSLPNNQIRVMGKGRKERMIPLSPRVSQILWKHMLDKRDLPTNEPLFTTNNGRAIRRDNLLKCIYRLANRAGVQDANIHRFRHTFAINFMRNGGNIFVLQSILGHSTLDMSRKYTAIAQVDIQAAHRRASPVMQWGL